MSNIDAELLGFTWCGCFLCCTNIHGDGSNIRVEYRLITKHEEFELNLNGDFMGSSAPIAVIAASQILKVKWRLMKLCFESF